MTRLAPAALALTTAIGCSAAGDLTEFTDTVELDDAPARPVDADRPVVKFTPYGTDIAPVLAVAITRWEAAGVAPGQLVTGYNGIPVKFVDDCIPWPDGTCRHGALTRRGIEVWVGSDKDFGYIVAHELGHAMGLPHLEHGGIMNGADVIDAETLQATCVLVYCDDWQPEAQ